MRQLQNSDGKMHLKNLIWIQSANVSGMLWLLWACAFLLSLPLTPGLLSTQAIKFREIDSYLDFVRLFMKKKIVEFCMRNDMRNPKPIFRVHQTCRTDFVVQLNRFSPHNENACTDQSYLENVHRCWLLHLHYLNR